MSNNINKKIWLIGAGSMAVDYAKVLLSMNINFDVIGRGENSAQLFKSKVGLDVKKGGLKHWIAKSENLPDIAIVAVNVEELANATVMLIESGVKKILVEKPAGLNESEIKKVAKETCKFKSEVYVAYNRRFFASTIEAKKIIDMDEGIKSFHFEFTEWSHIIKDLNKPKKVLNNWLLANSSHVIDLAFFLGGKPKEFITYTEGKLNWHPSGSIFVGSGITDNNALFSYHANWEAPGRWALEFLTKKHRLIFRPMEKLQIQNIGSINTEFIQLDDELDIRFKPGLYRQVEEFLEEIKPKLLSIEEQRKNLKFYEMINGSK